MRKILATAAAFAMMSAPMLAAEFKGKISDAMCNAKHADGDHGTKKMTDRECVEACVKGEGSMSSSARETRSTRSTNQDFAGLKAHAGHDVTVTGTMKDDTVTITKIDMPAKK